MAYALTPHPAPTAIPRGYGRLSESRPVSGNNTTHVLTDCLVAEFKVLKGKPVTPMYRIFLSVHSCITHNERRILD